MAQTPVAEHKPFDAGAYVDAASAAIGLVIGTIVLLMYFPMFELAGSIQ